VFCLKLFVRDEYHSYEREVNAYAYLNQRGVKRCIPLVYYRRAWPRWRWDGAQPDDYNEHDRDEILYGIVMEFFEDCQEIDMRKADIRTAQVLAQSLERIHEALVVHRDIEERNILVLREAGKQRIVFIDFSSAWLGFAFKPTRSLEWNEFRAFLYENIVHLQYIYAE